MQNIKPQFPERVINIFLHQEKLFTKFAFLNRIASQVIVNMLNINKQIQKHQKTQRELNDYGQSIKKQQKLEIFFATLKPCFDYHEQFQDLELKKIFINSILSVSELLMKLSTDLTNPGILALSNLSSLKRISILPLAIGFLQCQEKQVSKSDPDLKQFSRICVLKIAKTRNYLDESIYSWGNQTYFHQVKNVQFIQLYFDEQQSQMDIQTQNSNKKNININLSQLFKSNLNNNFFYFFKNVIVEEINFFKPDFIIFQQQNSLSQVFLEYDYLGLVMKQLIQISNCRLLYYKEMGVYQNLINGSYKFQGYFTEIQHKQLIEEYQLQDNPAKKQKFEAKLLQKLSENDIFMKKSRENLLKQFSMVSLSLQQNLDFNTLYDRYYQSPLDTTFLTAYNNFINIQYKQQQDSTTTITQIMAKRLKMQNKVRLSAQIVERKKKFEKIKQQVIEPEFISTFFNLKTNSIEQIKINGFSQPIVIRESDQYYIRYYDLFLRFIIFTTQQIIILNKQQNNQLFQLQATIKYTDLKTKTGKIVKAEQQSLTQSCLVASNNYLYRAFGKKNRRYTNQNANIQHTIQYSNKIFRLSLPPTSKMSTNKMFQFEFFADSCEQNLKIEKFVFQKLEKINNSTPGFLELQKKSNASAIFIQNNVYIFGGYLESNSQDKISKTIIKIENDKKIFCTNKISQKIFDQLLSKKTLIFPLLYSLPFYESEKQIKILYTNAFVYELSHINKIYANLYKIDNVPTQSSFVNQTEILFSSQNYVNLGKPNQQKQYFNNDILKNLLITHIIKSTQNFNRYKNSVGVMLNSKQALIMSYQQKKFILKQINQKSEIMMKYVLQVNKMQQFS